MFTPFNAFGTFSTVAAVFIGAAIICFPYLGLWGFVPVIVVLYYTWGFYRQLESRDRRDQRRWHRRKRRSRW